MVNLMQVMQGDCLELMKDNPDKSIDLILCDPPYGTTPLEWDKRIPFEPLWEQYNRIIKDNGAILLFSQQPFATDVINSNRKLFRYEIIWEKTMPLGFLNANRMPLRAHENILIFYKHLPVYNPQKSVAANARIGHKKRHDKRRAVIYGETNRETIYIDDGTRYPHDVVHFTNWNGALFGNTHNAQKHPTAKPVPLLEYLIKTYTNEGDTVLDNCMGSGSTGVACINTGRNFIGMELDGTYFNTAKTRIAQAQQNPSKSPPLI